MSCLRIQAPFRIELYPRYGQQNVNTSFVWQPLRTFLKSWLASVGPYLSIWIMKMRTCTLGEFRREKPRALAFCIAEPAISPELGWALCEKKTKLYLIHTL